MTDTERLDWLERNLMHISHARATHSLLMDGTCVFGQLLNEVRGSGAGPTYFKMHHKSIREAIDDASNWKEDG